MASFQGFPKDFVKFFKDLAKNNNRPWFEENKPRYQDSVVTPMLAFIEAMQAPLARISPHYRAIPKAHGGSMFRIYRDTRFSKDKTPYKTHAAAQFRHAGAGIVRLHAEHQNGIFRRTGDDGIRPAPGALAGGDGWFADAQFPG